MKSTVSAVVVAGMLGTILAHTLSSAYAACSLRDGHCYLYPEVCPQTQDYLCHYDPDVQVWFRVKQFYGHYKCITVSSTVPKCDIDDGNFVSICADVYLYASEPDCHAGNWFGMSSRVSESICSGATKCT